MNITNDMIRKNQSIHILSYVILFLFSVLSVHQFDMAYGHSTFPQSPPFILSESFSHYDVYVGDTIILTGKIQNHFDHDIYVRPDVYVTFTNDTELLSNKLYFEMNSTFSNNVIMRQNQIIDFELLLVPLQPGIFHIHSSTNPHTGEESGPNFLGLGKTITVHNKTNGSNDVVKNQNTVSLMEQLREGTPLNNIRCKDSLILIQKYDGSPACVTFDTREKLIERGWAKTEFDQTKFHNNEIIHYNNTKELEEIKQRIINQYSDP